MIEMIIGKDTPALYNEIRVLPEKLISDQQAYETYVLRKDDLMKHSSENRQPKNGLRRVIAILLALSMLLIPVNFPSEANAVENTTVIDETFDADLSQNRNSSVWTQGYKWVQNEGIPAASAATMAVDGGKLVATRGANNSKPSFVYVTALDGEGVDAAAAMTDYTLETTFSRVAAAGAASTANTIIPSVYFRLQKTDLGYTGYYIAITGKNNSTTVVAIVRKLVPTASNGYEYENIMPVGQEGTSASFGIANPTTGDCPIKVELDGDGFTLYYTDSNGNPAEKSFVDENVGGVGPYLSGTVALGLSGQPGTVRYESVKVTIPTTEDDPVDPPVLSNEFTDDFSAALSQTRTAGPWENGYSWFAAVKETDISVVDGKLKVVRNGANTMAYIKAMDVGGSTDYATQLTNFTVETKFTRYAPDGVTSGKAVNPRIYLRLNNTPLGYTGYYVNLTGSNDGTTGTLSIKKMLPTETSPSASTAIAPYPSVSIAEGVEHTIKVEVVGATFYVYYDGVLVTTVVDENVGEVAPYMSGSVGVGVGANNGTVTFDDFHVTLQQEQPPANLTNEVTEEFTTDLSAIREVSPWEQGHNWRVEASEGDITLADGKLNVLRRAGSKNYTLAYMTALDAQGNDAAAEMEDYEFEVELSRFAPEGVSVGGAINPRVYFRLQNTPDGYTGYYLTITGTIERFGGTMSMKKMTPNGESSTVVLKPYFNANIYLERAHTMKVVAEGNVFKVYFDDELKEIYVDEGFGGVDPYLTGTVGVGAAANDGTVKFEYAKLSLIQKSEEEKKFKKYRFYGELSDFADRWDMGEGLDIVNRLLVNNGNATATAVLKSDQYLTDYAVDASVTLPLEGSVSLLGRYAATSNSFYELEMSKTDGLVLSKTVGGTKTVLKTVTPAEFYTKGLKVLGGESYDLKLQMYGKSIEAYINGQIYAFCEDDSIDVGVGGMILDPGASVEYLEIAKVNAIVSIAVMEDTNRNGIDKKLGDYLVPFDGTIEVPVGRTPEIKYLYVKATFFNGDVKYVPVDTLIPAGFDVDTVGEKTAIISYLNIDAELKYKVVDRSAMIAELVQNISALNVQALTIDDKEEVYALEDIYNDLTPAEKETIADAVKQKLADASETIELLVYPELVGSQIAFEDRFDTADSTKQYNSATDYTADKTVGYWYVENGNLLHYSADDSVRSTGMCSSIRLDNRNFEVTSISVDVQVIDRDVWVGLDFHANGLDRYRFYFCDKTSIKNTETGKYGNRVDLYKGSTRITREWKYEDFWQPGEWVNLRVTYVDGIIRCYIDDVLWVEYADSTNPLASGSFGVVSAEGWTRYDNLVVRGVEKDAESTSNKINTDLEPKDYTDDFEDETAGKSPSHWIEDNFEDNWKVKLDGTDLVYGNENSTRDNYSHSWLHVFDQDVDYAVKLKVTELGDFPLVGITARYNYDESYIKAGYDFTRQQWFIKVRYGYDFAETVVYSASDAPKMEVGTWYDLRLIVVDEKLALYVNGSENPIVTADAGRKVMSGRVGVFTERCNADIDDVKLTMISGQSHVQDGVLEYTINDPDFKYPTILELSDGSLLYMQTDMRLISYDKGQTYEAVVGYDATSAGSSHIRMHNGDYLAVANKNVYVSKDEGKNWNKITELPLDSNTSYAHTGDRICEIQLADGTYRIFVTIDARCNNNVICGAERVVMSEIYYSDDCGATWTKSSNGPTQYTNLIRYAETNIIKATDGNLIQYCSYNPSDCIRYSISYDNGVTWEGDYALPELYCGVVSFCVKEDPYEPGTYYMVTVYNIPLKFNGGFPRQRISLFKSTDGYNWDFLCDVDRWGDVSDGGRRDIMQNVNMYLTITEDYIFPMFARSERWDETAHNMHFGRVCRIEKSKLEVQEFPKEYIVDGKHITYIEGVEEQITLNSDYSAKKFVVHYYDGTSEFISLREATVSGVDTSVLGKQTVTVDYENFRAIYEIEIVKGAAPTMNVADGKTYCIKQEVTVSDANGDLEYVTLNGEAVTLVDGKFTVTGKEGQQTIVATDKAGNVTTVKITVNAAHIGGTATCEDKAVCSVCNVEYGKLADHKGGTATCTDKAKCDVCGEAYGEKNADKHTKEAKWTITADKHSKAYECCGKVVVAEEDHEWKNGKCEECGYEAAPGTEQKPIEIPADKETVKTEAELEAGSELYYELDEKMAGMTITIKGEGAYAIIEGKKYEAVNGVLEVKLPAKTGKILVIIGNAGTKAGTFSITIATPSPDNSDTGDNAAIVLFGSLMALSMLAAGALLIPNIRKKFMK